MSHVRILNTASTRSDEVMKAQKKIINLHFRASQVLNGSSEYGEQKKMYKLNENSLWDLVR